jgi:hypothetical protein
VYLPNILGVLCFQVVHITDTIEYPRVLRVFAGTQDRRIKIDTPYSYNDRIHITRQLLVKYKKQITFVACRAAKFYRLFDGHLKKPK